MVRVKAPIIEAQLVETALLLAINHQTLIATKSRRIVQASEQRAVMEFGARRAHNFDAAILGARAAILQVVQEVPLRIQEKSLVCLYLVQWLTHLFKALIPNMMHLCIMPKHIQTHVLY